MMGFKKGDVFWEGRLVGEMVDVWLWGVLRGEGDLGLLVIYVPFFICFGSEVSSRTLSLPLLRVARLRGGE